MSAYTANYRTEPGTHPGWTWHYFEYEGTPFKLLTEDTNSKQRSVLYDDISHHGGDDTWLPGATLCVAFDCVLTKEDAYRIVELIHSAAKTGHRKGMHQKASDIREALYIDVAFSRGSEKNLILDTTKD